MEVNGTKSQVDVRWYGLGPVQSLPFSLFSGLRNEAVLMTALVGLAAGSDVQATRI